MDHAGSEPFRSASPLGDFSWPIDKLKIETSLLLAVDRFTLVFKAMLLRMALSARAGWSDRHYT